MEIIDTGIGSAEANMLLDGEMLEELQETPLLHFYEWQRPSATYGLFVKVGKFFDLEAVGKRGLDLAKRPTGGGITFHLWDLAFSFLLPSCHSSFSQNPLENYAFIHRAVLNAIQEFLKGEQGLSLASEVFSKPFSQEKGSFCFSQTTKYDLLWKGKKVAGAAQRKKKQGFLHQGSIFLLPPDEDYLKEVLRSQPYLVEAFQNHSFFLLGKEASQGTFQAAKKTLRILLAKWLEFFVCAGENKPRNCTFYEN